MKKTHVPALPFFLNLVFLAIRYLQTFIIFILGKLSQRAREKNPRLSDHKHMGWKIVLAKVNH